jgi:HAE1 family hydrophobic/amphiphilic exporter-1
MKWLSQLSVKRPVTVVMIVLIFLLIGAISLVTMTVDLLPEMDLPVAIVVTSYSGAAPEEIETLITKPLEASLGTVHNIDSIQSMSSRGTSIIIVMFNYGTDMDNATLDMREKVDLAQMYFPDAAEKPMVVKMDPNMMPILYIGMQGDMSISELNAVAEDEVQGRLERIEGVASADILGAETDEISVIVEPEVLQAYGISVNSIVSALRAENVNASAGDVEAGEKEYLVRILGEFQTVDQIGEVNIPTVAGATLQLKEIAEIEQGFADSSGYVTIDGKKGIALTVNKQSDGNTVDVSRNVRRTLEEINEELPGVELNILFDQATFIEDSISNIVSDILLGAIIAVVILLIFLRNFRSTAIVSVVIPISLVATFAIMYFQGTTLNLMTLGGLALCAGNMVDNAIVILDNIFRHREAGEGMVEASIKGSNEMANAITASTLTQMSVFLPLIFVGGLAAELFAPLAKTVVSAQGVSLLMAVIMVPLLCSRFLKIDTNYMNRPETDMVRRVMEKSEKAFNTIDAKYRDLLHWALGHKKIILLSTAGLLVVSLVLIPVVGMELLPESDQGSFTVTVELEKGAQLAQTTRVVQQVEEIVDAHPEVDTVLVNVGSGMSSFSSGGSETANFQVKMVPLNERDRSTGEIAQDVREEVAKISGAEITVAVTSMMDAGGGMGSAPISVGIQGPDLEELAKLADQAVEIVRTVEGTREVESDIAEGAPEVTLTVDRGKLGAYGLSTSTLTSSVQSAILGSVATRYSTGEDEIDVRVRFPANTRETLSDLENLSIATPTGVQIPLSELGEIEIAEGPTTINRLDQERIVTVSSQLYERDLASVQGDIEEKLNQELVLPRGYSIEYGGESQQMVEAFGNLGYALILAVVLVYMVLAAQFESFLYPFIIMFSVPLLFIGAVFGLLITGRTISIMAIIGVITLVGIVVNNGIVLVDWINQLRDSGVQREEAILLAGPHRLRAILMTALTTGLAMVPMALGIGEGAEMSAPMATVVVFGLGASTLLTLVVVPVMYVVMDNFSIKVANKFRGRKFQDDGGVTV